MSHSTISSPTQGFPHVNLSVNLKNGVYKDLFYVLSGYESF